MNFTQVVETSVSTKNSLHIPHLYVLGLGVNNLLTDRYNNNTGVK